LNYQGGVETTYVGSERGNCALALRR